MNQVKNKVITSEVVKTRKFTINISPFLLLLLPLVFGLLIYSGQYRTRNESKMSKEKVRPVVVREINTRVK